MRKWVFNHIDFNRYPVYHGNDLGVFWSLNQTSVRIWAPTAQKVIMRLYTAATAAIASTEIFLTKSDNGTWQTTLNGNHEGKFYTFQINDGKGWLNECPDIYARATGINGLRGMIYHPEKSHPEGWEKDKRCTTENPAGMIIYESHVRDFSISATSGVAHRGKYLGFTERGTKLPTGETTGIDHLADLVSPMSICCLFLTFIRSTSRWNGHSTTGATTRSITTPRKVGIQHLRPTATAG